MRFVLIVRLVVPGLQYLHVCECQGQSVPHRREQEETQSEGTGDREAEVVLSLR